MLTILVFLRTLGRRSHGHAGVQPAEPARELPDEVLYVSELHRESGRLLTVCRDVPCDDLATDLFRRGGPQGPHRGLRPSEDVRRAAFRMSKWRIDVVGQ